MASIILQLGNGLAAVRYPRADHLRRLRPKVPTL